MAHPRSTGRPACRMPTRAPKQRPDPVDLDLRATPGVGRFSRRARPALGGSPESGDAAGRGGAYGHDMDVTAASGARRTGAGRMSLPRWRGSRVRGAGAAAAMLAAVLSMALMAGPAAAQTPQVRLAAAKDCPRNINCIPGLKRVYHLDPTSLYTPLAVA